MSQKQVFSLNIHLLYYHIIFSFINLPSFYVCIQIFELEQDEEYHIPHNSPVKPRKSPSLILDHKKGWMKTKNNFHYHFKGFIKFFTIPKIINERTFLWMNFPSYSNTLSFILSFSSHSYQIDALFYTSNQYHSKQQKTFSMQFSLTQTMCNQVNCRFINKKYKKMPFWTDGK